MFPNGSIVIPTLLLLFSIVFMINSSSPNQMDLDKIPYDNREFLSNWNIISVHGKQNCGIYTSAIHPDRIIKCTEESKLRTITDAHRLSKQLNQKGVNIIPQIHKIYVKEHHHMYVEMERMMGSIKQLIYEQIPKMALDSLSVDTKLKDDIWLIYTHMSPFFEPNHKHKLIDYNKEINKLKKSTHLTFDTYDLFMNRTIESIANIIPTLKNQIIMTRIYLYLESYQRTDNHLNNYAYKLTSKNEKHMNVLWKDNQLPNGQYLKVYLIDFDSLSEKEAGKTATSIVEKYNKNFIDTYEIKPLVEPLTLPNIRNFPSDIVKITATKYTISYNDDPVKFNKVYNVAKHIIGETDPTNDNQLLSLLKGQ